jgi:hypothetical protein
VHRPAWKRLVAAAAVLTLVSPVLASGEEMTKKEETKAPAAKASVAIVPAGKTPAAPVAKKKNCPVDGSFNTMEDMFGSEDAAEMLAAQQKQAAPAQTVAGSGTPVVRWRTVQPSVVEQNDPPKKDEDKDR